MVTIKIGNIFDSKCSVLVNTVNCEGVMGKGIAKDFKNKYPEMFLEYKQLCVENKINPGKLYPYFDNNKLILLNFPTKIKWRLPSQLSYIEKGLDYFVENYKKLNIESIAFPPLGCGNGGLTWDVVGPLMFQKLNKLPIDIEIYAPYGTPKSSLSVDYLNNTKIIRTEEGIKYKKIKDKWILPLIIVNALEKSEYSIPVGRVIFQKICYVLQYNNVDLGLTFTKGNYGPYSNDIKDIITILSNNNLITEKSIGKMILLSVNDFNFDKEKYSNNDIQNTKKTYNLFRRLRNTDHAEMATTILYTYKEMLKKYSVVTENNLVDKIFEWKNKYNTSNYNYILRDMIKSLNQMNYIKVDYSNDNTYDHEFIY